MNTTTLPAYKVLLHIQNPLPGLQLQPQDQRDQLSVLQQQDNTNKQHLTLLGYVESNNVQ